MDGRIVTFLMYIRGSYNDTEFPRGEASDSYRNGRYPGMIGPRRLHTEYIIIEMINIMARNTTPRGPKEGKMDKFCDYHEEIKHCTNNFYQLKRQIEMHLKSGQALPTGEFLFPDLSNWVGFPLTAEHIENFNKGVLTSLQWSNKTARGLTIHIINTHKGNSQVKELKKTDTFSLHPNYSSKNHVRKFLRALPLKWRAKVTVIKEAKDLATLPLDELVGNLKVYEMILENDGVVSKTTTKDKVKSLALKANITRGQTSNNSNVRRNG
ncbi:hypothetical protein Tco_1200964 [Tanacetum coccineum]